MLLEKSWKQQKEEIELEYNKRIEALVVARKKNDDEIKELTRKIEDQKETIDRELMILKKEKKLSAEILVDYDENEKMKFLSTLKPGEQDTKLKIEKSLFTIEHCFNLKQELESSSDKIDKDLDELQCGKEEAEAEASIGTRQKL